MDEQLDRILLPDYLGTVAERSTAEIRSMRAESQSVETQLSYLRRLVQGRQDIVAGELARRERGGAPGDYAQLVEDLPEILADRIQAPGNGRLPQTMAPGNVEGRLSDRLDGIISAHGLANLETCDHDELETMGAELQALEHDISELRRAMFDRIDALQAELTRRYRDGEAQVDDLLHEQPRP